MGTIGTQNRYVRLLEYLNAGWEIEPPVHVNRSRQTQSETSESYQFVLHNGQDRRTLSVPECSDLRQFVHGRNLPIYRL